MIVGFVCVVLAAWFKVYSTPYVQKAIDFANDTVKKYPSGTPYAGRHLLFLMAVLIGMGIISGFFLFLTRQMLIVTSRLIEYDLKNEVFEHYQKLDLAFYKRNNTGDLMNRISEDVSHVRMYIGPAIMYTANTIAILSVTLVVMLSVNARFTLYVLAPMPLLYFAIYYVSSRINSKSTFVQQQLSTLFTRAQETFSGIRVIKAFRLEKALVADYDKECQEYKKRNMSLVIVDSLFQPFVIVLVGLSAIIIVYVGGNGILHNKISIGTVAEFIIYVYNLTMPIASLGWITSLVQRAAASQTRINEFLRTEPTIKSLVKSDLPLKGSIAFADVTFVYPDSGIKALDHVSFEVAEHESLGIVGKTGSGKSTIAQLICRLYDPATGSVKIDGRDIRQYALSSLREHIGYVPQEVFLFSDSIANNIAFSVSDKTANKEDLKAAVQKAAKDAVIYDNIMEFPQGFETMVGERGITLSGGQKQRVSIARAMLKAPGILIFDDSISAVDTNTEQEILLNIQKIMQGRTTLIISHRISSVKLCDKIIVLDKGKVVEHGTHDQLLMRKGMYREMYEMQLTEEETTAK
jgi:ATP-binding cassette subfamily B protein